VYIEHGDFIGQANSQYWEFGKGVVAMRAMLSCPQSHSTLDLSDGDRWLQWTNDYVRVIAQEPARALRVQSNAASQVWAKALPKFKAFGDGAVAVTLRNSATNFGAVTNITAYMTNLGFTASQLVGVFNAWSNRFEYSTNGQFTAAVTNISAETYIMYPVASNVLTETFWPNQIWFNPAPGFVGSAVEGPASMSVANVAWTAATTDIKWFLFPPTWAISATIAYGLQTDQTTSYWTNNFAEYQWDVDGARTVTSVGGTSAFNVNGTSAAIHRFTNSIVLSSHMPMAIRSTMPAGTNTTGNRFLLGPITATWR